MPSRHFKTNVVCLASVILTLSIALPSHAEILLDRGSPTEIRVNRPALYPEGIDYDPKTDRFFLSSVRDGSIAAVKPDGHQSVFARHERLISTIGVRLDVKRRRLLVANGDYGVAVNSTDTTNRKAGGLAIFDLDTGALVRYIDLAALKPGAPIFPNDLDVDADGNVYITNSLSPMIYKVTPDGDASIFLTHDRFIGQGFSLNGIQVHPKGFLIVAKKSDGLLFRIPLHAPSTWSQIKLPESFAATDGIKLVGNNLILIRNRAGQIVVNELVLLRSADGWQSGTIAERMPLDDVYTTTAAMREGEVWAAQGHLHTLRPGGDASLSWFTIRRIATQ